MNFFFGFIFLLSLLSASRKTTQTQPATPLEVTWEKIYANIVPLSAYGNTAVFSWMYELFLVRSLTVPHKGLEVYYTDQLICKFFDLVGKEHIRGYQCGDVFSPAHKIYEKTDYEKFRLRALASKMYSVHLPVPFKDIIKDLCAYQMESTAELKTTQPLTNVQRQASNKCEYDLNVLFDFKTYLFQVAFLKSYGLLWMLQEGITGSYIIRMLQVGDPTWKEMVFIQEIETNFASLFIVEKHPELLADGLIGYHLRLIARTIHCKTKTTEIDGQLMKISTIKSSINQAFPAAEDKLHRIREMFALTISSSINLPNDIFTSLLCYGNFLMNIKGDTMVAAAVLLERLHLILRNFQRLYWNLNVIDHNWRFKAEKRTIDSGILSMRNNALTAIYRTIPVARNRFSEPAATMRWMTFYFEVSFLLNSLLNQHLVHHGPTIEYDVILESAFEEFTKTHSSWCPHNKEQEFSDREAFLLEQHKQLGLVKEIKEESSVTPFLSDDSGADVVEEDIDALVAMIKGPELQIKKQNEKRKPSVKKTQEVKAPKIIKWESQSDDSAEDISVQVVAKEDFERPESFAEKPSNEVLHATLAPSHIRALIDLEDRQATSSIDPRDVAYAYLMIGNEVYIRYLSPFLDSLKQQSFPLHILFKDSIQKFQSEVQLMTEVRPEVIENAFDDAGISGMEFFGNCIRFYEKRLKVAHPHFSRDVGMRRWLLKMYVSQLNGANHSKYGDGQKLIHQDESSTFGNVKELVVFEPLQRTDDFPGNFIASSNIDFELAVLALTKLLPRTGLNTIRCQIAHSRPRPEALRILIKHIFRESSFRSFLREAFNH